MNFYKQAATAIDHLDTKQGSVKGSIAAAGVGDGANGKEGKRILACMPLSSVFMDYIFNIADTVTCAVNVSQWSSNHSNVSEEASSIPPKKQTSPFFVLGRSHHYSRTKRQSQAPASREENVSSESSERSAVLEKPVVGLATRLVVQQGCQDPSKR